MSLASLPKNMRIIVSQLQNHGESSVADNERWIDAKAGWNNYIHTQDRENLVSKISALPLAINSKRLEKGLLPLKKNNGISEKRQLAVKNNQYRESEVVFERKIPELNKNIYNQLCLGNGNAESVDLVYSGDGIKKEKLIEFKTISNTPIYGMIELIKNYCLLKKFEGEANYVDELIFLAPKDYFIIYKKNQKSAEEFFKTINTFNSENSFRFSLKYIDLDNEICKKIISNEKDTEKYYKHLLFENWKEIRNLSDWLNIK